MTSDDDRQYPPPADQWRQDGEELWRCQWTARRDGRHRTMRLTAMDDRGDVRLRLWTHEAAAPESSADLRPMGSGLTVRGRDVAALVDALARHAEDIGAPPRPVTALDLLLGPADRPDHPR